MDTCLTRAYDRILRDDAKEATGLLDEVCIHGVPTNKIEQRVVGGIASSGG